jgi:hypothetical protein
MVVSPRRFGGRRMVEGGEEEEFMCEITKSTKGIKESKGKEKDMIGIAMRDNGFIANFAMGCFVVRFV